MNVVGIASTVRNPVDTDFAHLGADGAAGTLERSRRDGAATASHDPGTEVVAR